MSKLSRSKERESQKTILKFQLNYKLVQIVGTQISGLTKKLQEKNKKQGGKYKEGKNSSGFLSFVCNFCPQFVSKL